MADLSPAQRAIRIAERKALTAAIDMFDAYNDPLCPITRHMIQENLRGLLRNNYPAPEPEWIDVPSLTSNFPRRRVRYVDGQPEIQHFVFGRWESDPASVYSYFVAMSDAIAQARAAAKGRP